MLQKLLIRSSLRWRGRKRICIIAMSQETKGSEHTTVKHFLHEKYGNNVSESEQNQCQQALVDFIGLLYEINRQKGIVHVERQ